MATVMATFGALSFLLLFMGTCCENQCSRTVRNEQFTEFMKSMNCEVDEKLLNLFTNNELFNKSILDNRYGNFMCMGLMDVLSVAPVSLCDFSDPLGTIPDSEFCSNSKMLAVLRKTVNGDVNANTVIVSNFTEKYCEAVCAHDTNQLCWAFGIIVRAVLEHGSVSTTVPTTDPTTVPTKPTDLVVPHLSVGGNTGPSQGDALGSNSNSNGEEESDRGTEQDTDKNIDIDSATTHSKTLTNVTKAVMEKYFDKQKVNNSVNEVKVETSNANTHDSEDEGSMNTGTADQGEKKNSTKAVTNQDDQGPSEAAPNLQDDGADHSNDNDTETPTSSVTETPTSSGTETPTSSDEVDGVNQTVTKATEDVTIQPGGTDDNNKTDKNYSVNKGNDPLDDDDDDMQTEDNTTDQPLDSDEQSSNQDGADFDDSDDGYSYWHFAAILLFILFLGVAGYLASLNRKKIRESVSTYMSKRKRRREYKPVNTMEAGLS